MRLLPAALAARTVLLIVAAIVVAEMATFWILGEVRRSAHVSQTTQLIAAQVRLLQAVLPGLDDAGRARLAEACPVGSTPQLQLLPDGPGVPTHAPDFGFGQHLAVALTEQLGEPVLLRYAGGHGFHHDSIWHHAPPPERESERGSGEPPDAALSDRQRDGATASRRAHGALWIGFMAGQERWWLVLPPLRFEPPELPPQMWVALALALAALVALASFFVRGIVGPLARLGEAVAATGDGARQPVQPEGPTEVRRLAEQHNTMLGQLQAAETERREMLAGLTHDLRAPLARLRLRVALLEDDAAEVRDGLSRDVDAMDRIVSQCLAFLRSEPAGNRPTAPLAIGEVLAEAVARQRELGRPVQWTEAPEAAGCRVAIEAAALQRVVDNLIDNALQYGAPPVELQLSCPEIGTPATPGTARHVCLSLRDHGPGIPASERARALEPFTQIEPARATGGSCGLGLAIVRRIVEGSGGELSLAEAEGGGLLILMRWPCA
ncbi:sensor histidine kinase [Rhodocyclus gracilis]|uniref:histidine kinase n=1 Tax=Rhodocyclus tenuis TaxID=1066 RepID=A0A6L5K070_RHOTE|nr:ATP-binding protein [Rhodocyclus gracilis]MQY51888.1 HAMP domain-containing protein [Rhodocyclus gracilis]